MRDVAIPPRIIERRCGGWIAVSGPGAEIRIGVTADSKEGALKKFEAAMLDWQRTLQAGQPTMPD